MFNLRELPKENREMEYSDDNITRTEKYKIAGIIGVAVFVVSMIIWSSFETQIQQSLNWFIENAKIVIAKIYDALVMR
jgi:hypothetical protein